MEQTQKQEGFDEDFEKRLQGIARKQNHSLHKRNPYKIELVRMFGDQVDSRLVVEIHDGMVRCTYTFWTESEGTIEEDFPSVDGMEEALEKGNKKFEEEVKKRGEDPEGW